MNKFLTTVVKYQLYRIEIYKEIFNKEDQSNVYHITFRSLLPGHEHRCGMRIVASSQEEAEEFIVPFICREFEDDYPRAKL